MTNGEKHIEKLLSWYKEAVTENGVCYLTSDDKNTLAYAIKCCKHFEDIKKDVDSWVLREELSSSEIPNKSIEEKCPCYSCEYFEINGWSHCKIHEDAYGDSRCNDYRKANQGSNKVNQGLNKSEIPTGSTNTISFKEMTDNLKITAEDIENAEDLEYSIYPLDYPKNDLAVDCISRDSAIKALDYDIKYFEFKSGVSKHMDDIAKLLNTIYETQVNNIKALPSVPPQEPRKGHWIPISSPFDSSDVHKCSLCGLEQDGATRFCPDCGADMREGEE